MPKKLCRDCNKRKPFSAFSGRGKQPGLQTYCKACDSKRAKKWFKSLSRQRRKEIAAANYARRKKKIQEMYVVIDGLKSKPCVDCGRCFPPCAMDFDHVRGTKDMAVATMMYQTYLRPERIQAEIAKCDLVCACCHRIRTSKRRVQVTEGTSA